MSAPLFMYANACRLTQRGRSLRIKRLGELPRLWNPLGAAMSRVDPRPLSLLGVIRVIGDVRQVPTEAQCASV